MWSIEDVSPEQLAKCFYHYHEALAQDCGGGNSGAHSEDKSCWDRASEQERKLMVAAARLALLELAAAPAQSGAPRPYYAVPGEAEWGC
jgi:hypothetical protein